MGVKAFPECMPGGYEKERASNLLELYLQMVMNYNIGLVTQTEVIYKNSKCS